MENDNTVLVGADPRKSCKYKLNSSKKTMHPEQSGDGEVENCEKPDFKSKYIG